MNDTPLIRIVLADDQSITRQGLSHIFDTQTDMKVVGEAVDGDEAVTITFETKPQFNLKKCPDVNVVLLTTFDVHEYAVEGIRTGAVGCLLKDSDTKEMERAYPGGAEYSSTTAGKALALAVKHGNELDRMSGLASGITEPLTGKELEVLQEMAYGCRNSEIAKRLYISEGTVKTHVHRILRKLDLADRTQAVVLAIRQGMVK